MPSIMLIFTWVRRSALLSRRLSQRIFQKEVGLVPGGNRLFTSFPTYLERVSPQKYMCIGEDTRWTISFRFLSNLRIVE